MEVIGGKPAELVIKETLFDPLGMTSSANFTFDDLEKRLVKNYFLAKDKHLGDEGALYTAPAHMEAAMVGPLGTVPGFARVITNCWDYTKLMQMLANGGVYHGERIMGRKTIDLMRTNTLSREMIARDFTNSYLAGYGYGYGVRTLMDQYAGHHNGSLGAFGLDRRFRHLGGGGPVRGGIHCLYAQSPAKPGGISSPAYACNGLWLSGMRGYYG